MLLKGKQVPGPCFDLEQFKVQLQAGNFHVYRTRALDPIRRLRGCGLKEARAYARDAILSLAPEDYAHTLHLPSGQLQDVYGKVIEADGWYLKIEIHIDDEQPGIVSCHPAEYELTTRRGVVPRSRRRFA